MKVGMERDWIWSVWMADRGGKRYLILGHSYRQSVSVSKSIMAWYRVGRCQMRQMEPVIHLQRGFMQHIVNSSHSHAERRWHFWQPIIAGPSLLSSTVASFGLISQCSTPLLLFLGEFSISTFRIRHQLARQQRSLNALLWVFLIRHQKHVIVIIGVCCIQT